jgi:hypothetical protein
MKANSGGVGEAARVFVERSEVAQVQWVGGFVHELLPVLLISGLLPTGIINLPHLVTEVVEPLPQPGTHTSLEPSGQEAGHPPHNIREHRIKQGVVEVTRMDHFCDPKYPGHMAFTIVAIHQKNL